MLDTIRDWPLPAKALGAFTGAAAAVGGWSVVASAVLMAYLDQPITHLPLTEWFAYAEHAPNAAWSAAANARVATGLKLSAAVPFVPVALAGAAALLASAKPRLAHDDARWANWRDLRRGGFNHKRGLYLGRVGGRHLRLDRSQLKHIAIYSPTRGGKGVGLVLPAGLTSEAKSMIYFDPKFEAFAATSGWQASQGAQIVLLAPLSPDGRTAQYNPCAYVRRGSKGEPTVDTYGDCRTIMHSLIPPGDEKSAFWTDGARTAGTGTLAFLSETDNAEFTIPAALDLLLRLDGPAYIKQCLDARRDAGRPYSKPCADALRDFLNVPDEMRDSIRKTITSKLGVFFDPRVRAAVSGNTFDLSALRHKRTALYIGVTPNDISALQPLITLLFQQFIALTMRVPPGTDPTMRYGVDVVLDELPRLGKITPIAEAFGDIAGYNVRFIAVMQTPAQLRIAFGQDGAQAILDNCKIEVAFGVDDPKLAEEISKRLGTVKGERSSRSAGLFGGGKASVSETERRLLTAFEIMQLPADQAIVLHGGVFGILMRRLRHYDMRPFKRRILPPPVIAPITVDLRYDEPHDIAVPPHLEPGGPPAPTQSAAKGSARPRKPADAALEADMVRAEAGMTLAQAEGVLAAVSPGLDLSRFAPDPAGAQALIDRVVHGAPAAKPARKQRKAA